MAFPADPALRARAAEILRSAGIQPEPVRPAPAAGPGGDLRARAEAALAAAGLNPDGTARTATPAAQAPATPPPVADAMRPSLLPPFVVSESGPRLVGMDGVRALARQYGVTDESPGSEEYRLKALAALEGVDTPEANLYRQNLTRNLDNPAYIAQRDAAPRIDPATGRPIADDMGFFDRVGNSLRAGVAGIDASFSEAAGQGLRAIGLDTAGDYLIAEGDRERAAARQIPISQETVDSRLLEQQEVVMRSRNNAQYEGAGWLPPGMEGARRRGDNPGEPSLVDFVPGGAERLAAAVARDPSSGFTRLAETAIESAPTTLLGLGATAVNPALGAGFYATTTAGQNLYEAATQDGERRPVTAREGLAAVASAVAQSGLDVVSDRLLIGRVGDAMGAAGIPAAARQSVAREITAGLARIGRAGAAQGATESGTETAQQVIGNAFARAGGDTDRDLLDGVAEAAVVGFGMGLFTGGAGAVGGEAVGAARQTQDPPTLAAETSVPAPAPSPIADEIDATLAALPPLPAAVPAVAPVEAPVETAAFTTRDGAPVPLGDVRAFVQARPDVSVSVLQRTFSLPYADALAALDALEAEGVVSPFDGTSALRTVLPPSDALPPAVPAEPVAARAEAVVPADLAPGPVSGAAVERMDAAAAVAPELSSEAAELADDYALATTDAERRILSDAFAALTGRPLLDGDATTTPAAPSGVRSSGGSGDGADAAGSPGGEVNRPLDVDGASAPLQPAGDLRGADVNAQTVDGQSVATDGAPVAADGPTVATGPKRRVARGQNEAVYVRFQDPLHAALYDYGSSIGSRSGNNPTRGQQKAGERRAALIALGVPEAQVEALAREEYNAVRAAAKAGAGGETLTPARLYDAAPATGYGTANTRTTRADVDAALATLRAKTGQLASNPLPDAETLSAWGTIAAFHIEAGARAFADFSARMVADAGEAVRPHLQRLFADAGGTEAAPEETLTLAEVRARIAERRAALAAPAAAPEPAPEAQTPETPPSAPEGAPEGTPDVPATVALNRAAITEARALLNLSELPPAAVRRWDAVLSEALDTGLVAQADSLALALRERPRAVSDVEHAALILRAAELQAQYAAETAEAERIAESGGDASYAVVRARASLVALDRVTEASDLAGREAARALSIRRLRLNAETFAIQTVLRTARVTKGGELTADERARLADLVGQVEAADRRVKELEARAEAASRARARKAAERAIAATPEAKRAAAKAKVKRDRAVILDELRALGLRVNDVTGLTVDGSILVGRLALTYAKEGALTLAEVVARVQQTLPDLAPDEIIEAVARPKTRQAERTEAELERARVERSRAQKAVRAAQRALAPRGAYDWIGEVLGAPRALMATGDMSAVLRQGAVLLPLTAARNPKGVARAFTKATRSFFSSHTAEAVDMLVRTDPRQYVREASRLYLAPIGEGASVATLTGREEAFMSRFLEAVPGLGQLMKASERHYTTFLNLIRVAAFDYYADAHPEASREALAAWADYVNKASGRGSLNLGVLGDYSGAAPGLSSVFFAPRFMASRFQTLAAPFKPGTPAAVRAEIALSLSAFVGTGLVALMLARLAVDDDDAEIGTDPRSPDFGKLTFPAANGRGDYHVDVWAGEQQVARLMARSVLVGTDHFGITDAPRRARETTPVDLATSFLKYKLAPTVTVPQELMTGKNAIGEDTTPGQTLRRAVLPLGVTSTLETYDEAGAEAAAAVFAGNYFGLGVNVY